MNQPTNQKKEENKDKYENNSLKRAKNLPKTKPATQTTNFFRGFLKRC